MRFCSCQVDRWLPTCPSNSKRIAGPGADQAEGELLGPKDLRGVQGDETLGVDARSEHLQIEAGVSELAHLPCAWTSVTVDHSQAQQQGRPDTEKTSSQGHDWAH